MATNQAACAPHEAPCVHIAQHLKGAGLLVEAGKGVAGKAMGVLLLLLLLLRVLPRARHLSQPGGGCSGGRPRPGRSAHVRIWWGHGRVHHHARAVRQHGHARGGLRGPRVGCVGGRGHPRGRGPCGLQRGRVEEG